MENVLILQSKALLRPAELEKMQKDLVAQAKEGVIVIPPQLVVLKLPGGVSCEEIRVKNNIEEILGKAEIIG